MSTDIIVPTAEISSTIIDYTSNSSIGPLILYASIILGELIPLIPTQPFAIASGLFFGGVKGGALATAGTISAATMAFAFSRKVREGGQLGSIVDNVVGEELDAIRKIESNEYVNVDDFTQKAVKQIKFFLKDEAASEEGYRQHSSMSAALKIVILRLLPIVPFSLSNYIVGYAMSEINFSSFFAGTAVGMLPWMYFYSFIGEAARKFLDPNSPLSAEELLFVILKQSESAANAIRPFLRSELVVLSALLFGYFVIQIGKKEDTSTNSVATEQIASNHKKHSPDQTNKE